MVVLDQVAVDGVALPFFSVVVRVFLLEGQQLLGAFIFFFTFSRVSFQNETVVGFFLSLFSSYFFPSAVFRFDFVLCELRVFWFESQFAIEALRGECDDVCL